MTRIIFCSLSDWEMSNLDKAKEMNLDIAAILQYHKKSFKRDLLDCEFISIEEILEFILIRDFSRFDPTEITPEYITATRREQLIAIEMMRRIDTTKNMTFGERRDIYFHFSIYWLEKLKCLKPDAIYFGVTPHEVGDYILYVVAQYLGIETLINNEAYVLGRRRICKMIESPEISHPAIVYEHYQGSDVDLQSWLSNQTNIRVKMYANWMSHIDELKPNTYENQLFLRLTKRLVVYLLGKGTRPRLSPSDLSKVRQSNLRWSESYFGILLYTIKKFISLEIINYERRLIARDRILHSGDGIFDSNFIVYFLSYQPEMLVSPTAGDFFDPIQNISMIASKLPRGWKLLVKEHPAQEKDTYGYNYLGRDPLFYSRISAINNVYLVKTEVPAHQLILKSKGVATISGTAGWQALALGKPVLVFGYVWYRSAPHAFAASSSNSINNYIQDCLDTTGTNNDGFPELLRYLEDYWKNSIEMQSNEISSRELGILWKEDNNRTNWNILLRQISAYF